MKCPFCSSEYLKIIKTISHSVTFFVGIPDYVVKCSQCDKNFTVDATDAWQEENYDEMIA